MQSRSACANCGVRYRSINSSSNGRSNPQTCYKCNPVQSRKPTTIEKIYVALSEPLTAQEMVGMVNQTTRVMTIIMSKHPWFERCGKRTMQNFLGRKYQATLWRRVEVI